MILNDAHCHFFSTEFFAALARQRQQRAAPPPPRGSLEEAMEEDVNRLQAMALCDELGWETPGSAFTLADRRSEEHTSELQSQSNLVCRLLLEKKKKKKKRRKQKNK